MCACSPEELEAQAQASETGATSSDPLQQLQDAHVRLHSGEGDADGVNPSFEQQDQKQRSTGGGGGAGGRDESR